MGTHPIFESDFDCLTDLIFATMSADDGDHDFVESSSGAALTYPMQCSALRKNGFVMIKGRACKIVDMSTSKTGKHGHAKVHMVALDIFDGKKVEDICPSTHNMEVPNVKRQEWQLIFMDDEGYVDLMHLETGEQKSDLQATGDVRDEIQKFVDSGDDALVQIQSAIGREMIMGVKNMPK